MSEEIRIPIAWGTLAAVASGPADGKRVLFLHGWLDNAASFEPLIDLLPSQWRRVALDLPGHGHSDHRPAGTAYHLIDAVTDVLDAADALGWDRFTLVGHSLGAGIASVLAGAFTDRLDALILIEGLGPFSSDGEETRARYAQYYAALKELRNKRKPIYPSLDQAIRARMQAGPLERSSAEALVTRGSVAVEGGFTWRSDPRLRLPTQRFTEDQTNSFLKAIACPAFCLVAEQGLMVTFPTWKERAAQVPGLKVEIAPGQHHLHLDSSSMVAPLLKKWVAAPAGAPPRTPEYSGK